MEKIIYYPGSWDILHVGHLNAIEYTINEMNNKYFD